MLGGNKGEGFSAQLPGICTDFGAADMLLRQASLLRQVADQIQAEGRRIRQRARGN